MIIMIGVIGGSGLYQFFNSPVETLTLETPYGFPSAPISLGVMGDHEVAFLPRHGVDHQYSAHNIPYQANMWALRSIGVRRILAPCAVGSLSYELAPGTIAVPDQLVDRTCGRNDTYFATGGIHVDFADPYCPILRQTIMKFPQVCEGGTMVVIQGPRFSTRAESRWFAQSGFRLINMTGYPEAVLARELEMCYAPLALVTDHDAGACEGQGVRTKEVFTQFHKYIHVLKELLGDVINSLTPQRSCSHCLAHDGVQLPFKLP